jgi:aerotaxis receptor
MPPGARWTISWIGNVTRLIAEISHSTSEQASGLSELTVLWPSWTLLPRKTQRWLKRAPRFCDVKHRAKRLEDAVTVH